MTKVRDVREYLKGLVDASPDDPRATEEIYRFFTIVAQLDSLSIEEAGRMLDLAMRAGLKPARTRPEVDIAPVVTRLREAFLDDARFSAEMSKIKADKSLTKDSLRQIFYGLFDRTRGVPKTATRDYIARLIQDERFLLARNAKAGAERGGVRPID